MNVCFYRPAKYLKSYSPVTTYQNSLWSAVIDKQFHPALHNCTPSHNRPTTHNTDLELAQMRLPFRTGSWGSKHMPVTTLILNSCLEKHKFCQIFIFKSPGVKTHTHTHLALQPYLSKQICFSKYLLGPGEEALRPSEKIIGFKILTNSFVHRHLA